MLSEGEAAFDCSRSLNDVLLYTGQTINADQFTAGRSFRSPLQSAHLSTSVAILPGLADDVTAQVQWHPCTRFRGQAPLIKVLAKGQTIASGVL